MAMGNAIVIIEPSTCNILCRDDISECTQSSVGTMRSIGSIGSLSSGNRHVLVSSSQKR